MKNKKVAIIDVGTLKCKYLIAEKRENKINILIKDKRIGMLGKDLEKNNQNITEVGLSTSIKALKEIKSIIENNSVDLIETITTEAIRRAKNSDYALDKIYKETGFKLKEITQEEEAHYFFNSIAEEFIDKVICVADIGGGSVQVIIGKNNEIYEKYMFPTGTYRLQQDFITNTFPSEKTNKEIRAHIEKEMLSLKDSKLRPEILIYGSSCIIDYFNLTDIPKNKLNHPTHTYSISVDNMYKFYNELIQLPYEKRSPKLEGDPHFIWDVDKAVMNILTIAKNFNIKEIVPTNNNISVGLLKTLF